MPASSLIIGVDLDSIKPIPNCITLQALLDPHAISTDNLLLQEDITTQKCRNELKRIMKNFKADVYGNPSFLFLLRPS